MNSVVTVGLPFLSVAWYYEDDDVQQSVVRILEAFPMIFSHLPCFYIISSSFSFSLPFPPLAKKEEMIETVKL